MLDWVTIRRMAETLPAVTLDSAVLLELLDAADRAPGKPKAPRVQRDIDPNDEKCARWLFGVVAQTAPSAKAPNYTTWANDVRLIRERDGRTHREICELFQWAHSDSFWCTNILCPKSLRDKWTRLAALRDRSTGAGMRTVPTLGKAGRATAQNAERWLEEHSNAA